MRSRSRSRAGSPRRCSSSSSWRPTRISVRCSYFFVISMAAGTTEVGPWSPPIASREMVMGFAMRQLPPSLLRELSLPSGQFLFVFEDLGRHDVAAAIVAIRADAMPQVRVAGHGATRYGRSLERIVRTTHAAAGRALATFLNSHGVTSIRFVLFQFLQHGKGIFPF